jgi:hypothetical protein
LATFQGKIRLALRNQLNQGQFFTKGVVTSQLAYKKAAPATPEQKMPSQPEINIEIIKGMQRSAAQL